MGKVVWEGDVDIGHGERVFITVRRTRPAVRTGKYGLSAEGTYQGQHFLIDGKDMEQLETLVKVHCKGAKMPLC